MKRLSVSNNLRIWVFLALSLQLSLAAAVPGGRVTDLGVADATQITLQTRYDWLRIDTPGSSIIVELWIHDSGNPMGGIVATVGETTSASSGSETTSVVATVAFDPVLSCTRHVMKINGVVVAQDFIDHAGSYCADNFNSFDTLNVPDPGGRVTDLGFATPVQVTLEVQYVWTRVALPNTEIVVEMWFHDSFNPAGDLVVTVGETTSAASGSTNSGPVATLAFDPVLSCTRHVMRIEGVVVSQDFIDHAGTYCSDNFTTFETLAVPEEIFDDGFEG